MLGIEFKNDLHQFQAQFTMHPPSAREGEKIKKREPDGCIWKENISTLLSFCTLKSIPHFLCLWTNSLEISFHFQGIFILFTRPGEQHSELMKFIKYFIPIVSGYVLPQSSHWLPMLIFHKTKVLLVRTIYCLFLTLSIYGAQV